MAFRDMELLNIVLATEHRGGKGGVATVIPMYIEALKKLGRVRFISTHNGRKIWGKFGPWIFSFFLCFGVVVRDRHSRKVFHLHPGSGFCIIRMLLLAILIRFVFRQIVVVYLHTPHLERYLSDWAWRRIVFFLVICSNRTIVLTAYAQDLFRERGVKSGISIVPNPFKASDVLPDRKRQVAHEVSILTMGRLVDGKGIIEVLRAIPFLPENYRLTIAGSGPLGAKIEREINKLGLDRRVNTTGWVSGKEKEFLLSTSRVFALPSTVDSFGMSFIEAQAHDLPIVAFKHPPVMEVLRPAGAVVVETKNPEVLAAAIERAASLSSVIEDGSGLAWVEENFGVRIISEKLERLMRVLINT
jgi:glycosyltransferase involved in cell wall biosynthesis